MGGRWSGVTVSVRFLNDGPMSCAICGASLYLSCKCCAAVVLLRNDKGCYISLAIWCCSVPHWGASLTSCHRSQIPPHPVPPHQMLPNHSDTPTEIMPPTRSWSRRVSEYSSAGLPHVGLSTKQATEEYSDNPSNVVRRSPNCTIVADIITILIIPEHSQVTNRSRTTNMNSQRLSAGNLWFCLPSASKETVINDQLTCLEFISSVIVG